MQTWIRSQSPTKIGAALHERFARSYEEGLLIPADLVAFYGPDPLRQVSVMAAAQFT